MDLSRVKLPEEFDRRCKLTIKQKEEIKDLYESGEYTYQQLADSYGVCKKTICLIVNEKAKEKQYAYSINYMKSYQKTLDKDAVNQRHRETRQYKKELMEKGLIDIIHKTI